MKAVVLAGGKSSRMGENKALLPLGEDYIDLQNSKYFGNEILGSVYFGGF